MPVHFVLQHTVAAPFALDGTKNGIVRLARNLRQFFRGMRTARIPVGMHTFALSLAPLRGFVLTVLRFATAIVFGHDTPCRCVLGR